MLSNDLCIILLNPLSSLFLSCSPIIPFFFNFSGIRPLFNLKPLLFCISLLLNGFSILFSINFGKLIVFFSFTVSSFFCISLYKLFSGFIRFLQSKIFSSIISEKRHNVKTSLIGFDGFSSIIIANNGGCYGSIRHHQEASQSRTS